MLSAFVSAISALSATHAVASAVGFDSVVTAVVADDTALLRLLLLLLPHTVVTHAVFSLAVAPAVLTPATLATAVASAVSCLCSY